MKYFPADAVVDAVAARLIARAEAGMAKFGISMEAEHKPFETWADEAMQEVLDAANYLEKAKRQHRADLDRAFALGRQHERDIIDEETQARYDSRQHELFVARLS